VLVEIDPLLAEVAVERSSAAGTRARSELALAKSNLERRSSLAERGVASTSALDDAVNARQVAAAALREAQAESKRARDDLAKKTIRARFGGVLRRFDVEVGEYIREGQQLGELLDTTTARITIGLSDRDVVAVRSGQPAAVEVEAYPGETFEGVVLRVGAASDPASKKFPVEVELPNGAGRLLPGMIATVILELGEVALRMLIPRDAGVDEFGLHSVFVIEVSGGEAGFVARRRRVGVRPVPFRPGEFEVVSGLEPGERIALTGVRQLRDGEPVRLRSTASP
jgi:membrane fusion protein (multidrug efflux system)